MKKVSATILLILASSALMFVMYIITAMSLLAVVGVPLALALFAGHVWAASLVQKRFENNGWLRKLQFLLCAGAPGIIMGVLLDRISTGCTGRFRIRSHRCVPCILRRSVHGGAWNGNVGEIFALTQK